MNAGDKAAAGLTETLGDLFGSGWLCMSAFMPAVLAFGGMAMAGTTTLLLDLVDRFAAAELAGDTDFLDQTLAADFTGIGPRGFMLTKEQWIDRFESGDLTHQSYTWSVLNIRLYGDTAIITGCQSFTGQHKGRDIQGNSRGTLIFVLIDGQWQIAGVQLSQIAEGAS